MPDRQGLRVLPRTYTGPVPDWPLVSPTANELMMWAELWTRPQAVIWHEEAVLPDSVAMYVRTLLKSQAPGATKAMAKVAHSRAVSLLLTPTSLRRAGYRVSPVEAVPPIPASEEE